MTNWSIEATTIGLVKAGFPKDNVDLLTKMCAICWGESAFNPAATNPRGVKPPAHGAYGLFQILYQAHPELFQRFKWDDGNDNCRMARSVYLSQGLSAWTVYTTGAYLIHMAECRKGVINGLHGDPGEVTGGIGPIDIPNPLAGIATVMQTMYNAVRTLFTVGFWERAGIILLGGILILFGLVWMMKDTDTGKAAVKAGEMAAMA